MQAGGNASKFVFELFDTEGKLVIAENIVSGKNMVNAQQLSTGLYTYSMRNADTGAMQYGKLQIQR